MLQTGSRTAETVPGERPRLPNSSRLTRCAWRLPRRVLIFRRDISPSPGRCTATIPALVRRIRVFSSRASGIPRARAASSHPTTGRARYRGRSIIPGGVTSIPVRGSLTGRMATGLAPFGTSADASGRHAFAGRRPSKPGVRTSHIHSALARSSARTVRDF